MRIVVCDTGPVLHLREAGVLNLLAEAGEVYVPPAVERELASQIVDWSDTRPQWIHASRLTSEDIRHSEHWRGIGGLGPGEAEAIALARSLRADWLLTDDAGARIVASLMGMEVHGSLGMILWAAANGHMQRDEASIALERLAKSSLWISPRILDEARQALARLFA